MSTSPPKAHPTLCDEQGKPSTARAAFWLVLLTTLILIVLDAVRVVAVPNAAYSLLGGTILALAGWAGGPRVMQYLGPQIGAVAKSLAQAIERPDHRDVTNPDAVE